MRKGFTIVEILIAIAIMVLLVFLILTSLPKLNSSQALSKDTAGVMAVISQARSMTLSSRDGVNYGVHIGSNQITLFKGSTYSSSDPNNSVLALNSQVTISTYTLTGGGSDIIFDRLKGTTSEPGSITLALIDTPTQTKIITVSATGIVNGTP